MTTKRTRFKSALLSFLLNFFVTLLCLAVCAGSVWIFWQDLNSSSVRTDKESIATISFKQKIAQRKFDDRVVWERLQQESELYEGDKIHTADLSQATIHFNNAVEIEIGENSMIQLLKNEEGGIRLSVSSGSVEVDTTEATETMQVDMGGVVVNLDSGSKLSAKNDGTNSIKLTEGTASVQSNGQMETLSSGEAVEVSKSGDIRKTAITVTSVSEKQKVLVFGDAKKDAAVELKWATQEKSGKKIIVQTSNKKDFSDVKNTYTASDANNVDIPADDGSLYWRVFEEGDEENAVTGKLLFENVPDVVCSLPEENAVFNYYGEKPKINFTWRGNDYAEKYKIEISKNENLQNPEIEKEAFAQNIAITDLEDGKYYWRVTPYYSINKIGWRGETAVRTFTVSKREKISPPELSFPVDNKRFEYTDSTFNADFAWKAENLNAEYELQISRDADFTDIILNETTKAKTIRKTLDTIDFGNGEYYWRIVQRYSLDSDGQQSLASAARKFAVAKKIMYAQEKLAKPEIITPSLAQVLLFGGKDKKTISLKWKKIPEADSYKVRIFDAATNKVLKEDANIAAQSMLVDFQEFTTVSAKPQKFNVQIQAFSNEKEDVPAKKSEYAESNFSVRLAKPVKLLSPEDNVRLDGLAALKNGVSLKWAADGDAYSNATLNLWKIGANGKATLVKAFTNSSEVVSLPRMEAGSYRWTVTAKTRTGATLDAETPRNFVVTIVPDLERAVLVSPSQNQMLDAAYWKKNRFVVFNWKAVPNATDYTFTLYQKAANGSLREIYSSKNQKGTQVRINDLKILDVGNFQWQVTAQNRAKDGFVFQKGKVASQDFRISFALPGQVETVDLGDMYGE